MPIPDRNRGNNILKLKKRSLRIEEGVSLHRRGRFFDVKKRPLCIKDVLSLLVSVRLSLLLSEELRKAFGGLVDSH
ncbi:hypothetical protein HMPREF0973_01528 [Prevotella veroralis F0319]|uniref:Uncharacterized protein n=1 Tax=Prevotella veroralis F0319 TaxID=649761 RepID=C9MPI7_9BACT|nr:hypothetical protein HMPREF0973_01528 [Prevotella veroralis F0319]